MMIKDACRATGLTKKAIEYYEQQGLLQPRQQENGYRTYDEADLKRLREIAILRRCTLSVPEIAMILSSDDKISLLQSFRKGIINKIQALEDADRLAKSLVEAYEPDKLWAQINISNAQEPLLAERLTQAFPGPYGRYLHLHFAPYLKTSIDTPNKRAAYEEIILFLDEIPNFLTPDLQELLEQFPEDEDILQASSQAISSAMENMEQYLQENQAEIQTYIEYRTSDSFQQSPAGKLQQAMLSFQQCSGYQERFIQNLAILSPAYREHLQHMEKANQTLLQHYPEAARLNV